MAKEIEKHDQSTVLFFENTPKANEECEYHNEDSKMCVWETAMTDNGETKDTKNDKIKQCTSFIVDNIKTELPSSELHHNTISDKDMMENEICSANIKIELKNEVFFCELCKEDYQDYCTKCGMLVYILNNIYNSVGEEIPKDIIEIRETFAEFSVFALKVIPVGVIFGPFTGLSTTDSWKVKGGRFIIDESKSKLSNWMRFVKLSKSSSEKNLLSFQYRGDLYYRSICEIQVGEELLLYFGEEYEGKMNQDVEIDFTPSIEYIVKDVFACTFCCLGFSSEIYLAKHNSTCSKRTDGKFSSEELIQCSDCDIYMQKEEYIEHHVNYCYKRNDRNSIPAGLGNKAAGTPKHRTQRRLVYTCTQCKYKTAYKSDLNNHTHRKHYKAKMYKCETCSRRYKTRESLKIHLEMIHMKVDGQEIQKYLASDRAISEIQPFKCALCEFRTTNKFNLNTHARAMHREAFSYKCTLCDYTARTNSTLWKHMKRKHNVKSEHRLKTRRCKKYIYKCANCEYKSYKKHLLETHFRTQHLKLFDYKCTSCEFKTNRQYIFNAHVKSKHLKKFSFKCELCEYKTNEKCYLQRHIKVKHLKQHSYKCETCQYGTDTKGRLIAHVAAKHLGEWNYTCSLCKYKTSEKRHLESHMKTRHLKEYNHKCELCDFGTNSKAMLSEHIKTKHLKEFDYNCPDCDYKTNHKSTFTTHVKRKHTKSDGSQGDVKRFRCQECDFQTNYNYYLTQHVQKHLKDVDYKCEQCHYVTYHKPYLDKHIKSKHLMEFKFKCDGCEYATNDKRCFNKHVRSKHLKEYSHKCALCDFQTNYKKSLNYHVKVKHCEKMTSDDLKVDTKMK